MNKDKNVIAFTLNLMLKNIIVNLYGVLHLTFINTSKNQSNICGKVPNYFFRTWMEAGRLFESLIKSRSADISLFYYLMPCSAMTNFGRRKF